MSSDSQPVYFYGRHLPYFEFSNFARYPIVIDGLTWPTSEHYYQAQKFDDPILKERVRNAATPTDAAAIGRDKSLALRNDWESVKDEVMLKALIHKFGQHPNLRELLLNTGNKLLVEHTKNDSYWGDNLDGTGKNKLGLLLMQVRDLLRS